MFKANSCLLVDVDVVKSGTGQRQVLQQPLDSRPKMVKLGRSILITKYSLHSTRTTFILLYLIMSMLVEFGTM
jgi:hypothetical protein